MALDEVLITRAIIERFTEKLLANLDVDVAVVGGGVSGLTAAWRLAGQGHKVAIFERKLSVGGGMWGGGMMFNEIVIQAAAKPVLDELGIRVRPIFEHYYTADAVEAVTTLGSQAIKAGATVFNCISVEDVMVREDRVDGLVIAWTAVEMARLHVDPLVIRSKYTIDATGHDLEVVKVLLRKNQPLTLNTPSGGIGGERSMWSEEGEKGTIEHTKEIYPGFFVAGMAATATAGVNRMGAIFGGMLLSGLKAADLIHARLTAAQQNRGFPVEYEVVIGLEVHAHLLTASKIFCGCATSFGAPPNTHVCEVCLGMPGSLPVLNKKAVEFALKMALATNCRVNPESVFARKNYFYPDLPKGYQISQYELPLAEHGYLDIKADGQPRRLGITRIHMEEDAGKLIHSESRPVSLVDFNRTGVPLIEIVSEPDMRTPEEAVEYLKALRNILLYLEICDGNMEEGSLRCDANISLRPVGQTELGTKAELKNMNSFRFVKAALEYEIKRQRAHLSAGREIVQETRLWDTATNQTVSMRGKEEAHDYRYFPDPDLVPVKIDAAWLASLHIPELPAARLKRFQADYDLPEYDAEVLTSDKALADYFEATVKEFPQPKQVSNWIMAEVLRELKKGTIVIGTGAVTAQPAIAKAYGTHGVSGEVRAESPKATATAKGTHISSLATANLLALVEKGTISGKQAKAVFEDMVATGKPPEAIVKEKGLTQISDTGALEAAAQEIINAHPQEVSNYKAGKTKVMGFFVGQLMKATKGQANPQLANEIFQRLLA